MLDGTPEGTYLVRLSAQFGYYAVSYVTAGNVVNHLLVAHDVENNGFRLETEGESYLFQEMSELIRYLNEYLRFPYRQLSNLSHLTAFKILREWKKDSATQLQQAKNIVDQIFDIRRELPAFEEYESNPAIELRVREEMSKIFEGNGTINAANEEVAISTEA